MTIRSISVEALERAFNLVDTVGGGRRDFKSPETGKYCLIGLLARGLKTSPENIEGAFEEYQTTGRLEKRNDITYDVIKFQKKALKALIKDARKHGGKIVSFKKALEATK